MAVFVDVWMMFMLINTSSIFEINMLVALAIMLYILELIMQLLSNYPTACLFDNRMLGARESAIFRQQPYG